MPGPPARASNPTPGRAPDRPQRRSAVVRRFKCGNWRAACAAGAAALAAVLLTCVVVSGSRVLASGERSAVFLVGGMRYRVGPELLEMDAAPFVDSGRTFVPVQYLTYALGAPEEGVRWDTVSQTITLCGGGLELSWLWVPRCWQLMTDVTTVWPVVSEMDVGVPLLNKRGIECDLVVVCRKRSEIALLANAEWANSLLAEAVPLYKRWASSGGSDGPENFVTIVLGIAVKHYTVFAARLETVGLRFHPRLLRLLPKKQGRTIVSLLGRYRGAC